jgi:hypothetical protein
MDSEESKTPPEAIVLSFPAYLIVASPEGVAISSLTGDDVLVLHTRN